MSKDSKLLNKKDGRELIVALFLLIAVVGAGLVGYRYIFGGKTLEPNVEVDVNEVKGFGESPQEALVKYISLNGNMGSVDEVNGEKLLNHTARNNNFTRRYDAYTKALEGLAPGSPLIEGDMERYMKKYSENLPLATYYSIDNDSIKVSKPSEVYGVAISDSMSQDKDYKAVDVYASFVSQKTFYYLKVQDPTSDGTYVEVTNKERFENVKFTLVEESKSNWRIFDMDDDGYISARFATWNPQSEEVHDVEKDVITRDIKQKEG